jgi:large subunit ribosomal protein L25
MINTEKRVLVAQAREKTGGSYAKSLRESGMVPAIIYGHGSETIMIAVEAKEINKYYVQPSFRSTVIEITVGDKIYKVIPHQSQKYLIKEMLMHVDFLHVGSDRQKVNVPIVYINKHLSPGIKRGGYLNVVKKFVLLDCNAKDIPKNIEVDASGFRLGMSFKASMLNLPADAKLLIRDDMILSSLIGRGKDKEDSSDKKPDESAKKK